MYKFISILSNVNSVTNGTDNNGGWFGEAFRKALIDFVIWLIRGLFTLLSPFFLWGCKIIIVWCVVTYFCANNDKSIATGLKYFLILVIFIMIRGVIL